MFSKNNQNDIYDSYGEDDLDDDIFAGKEFDKKSEKLELQPLFEEQFIEVRKNKSGHWVAIYEDMYADDGFFNLDADSLKIRIFNGQKYNIDVSQDKQALFLIEEYEAYEENEQRK